MRGMGSTLPIFSIITPTHNTKYLAEAYASLQAQTYTQWEWVVVCNGPEAAAVRTQVVALVNEDPRVKLWTAPESEIPVGTIGALKRFGFMRGIGAFLVEFDHDDLLVPHALQALADAAEAEPDAGFFFSDFVDFEGQTYGNNLSAWIASGWRFRFAVEDTLDATVIDVGEVVPCMFPPSAASLSRILWAPNHVRVWRTETYHALDGHDAALSVCDDHELLIRTYLETRMHHIPQVLYKYRVHAANTWTPRAAEIAKLSADIGARHIESLVLREASLTGLPAIDLGASKSPRLGWVSCDIRDDAAIVHDLRVTPWPWADNSVQAFRANDLLEHLPDKQATMKEIWRCLAPGGWLLAETPSTDGRGAFMDPTHVSYWNEPAFWYWIRDEQAHFIDNTDMRFQVSELGTYFPGDWHKTHNISYVRARLWKPGKAFPRATI